MHDMHASELTAVVGNNGYRHFLGCNFTLINGLNQLFAAQLREWDSYDAISALWQTPPSSLMNGHAHVHATVLKDVDEGTKASFYLSGHHHVLRLRKDLSMMDSIGPALDFGCGIGRVAFNLIKISTRVACVDHSDRYLSAAKYEWQLRHGYVPLEAIRFVASTTDLLAAVQVP